MIMEHEMISITAKRACYQCGRKMKFEEMVDANKDKPEDYLRMIWEDPLFELYCCGCFKREMLQRRGIVFDTRRRVESNPIRMGFENVDENRLRELHGIPPRIGPHPMGLERRMRGEPVGTVTGSDVDNEFLQERYSLEDLLSRRREIDRPDSFFSEYYLEPSSDDENEL